MSDFIGDLRRDLEQRLKDVERELASVEPLLRERDRLRAALAHAAVRDPAPARAAATGARRARKAAHRALREAPTARRS